MTVSFMSPHSPYTPLPAVADAPVPPPHISPAVGQTDLSGLYPPVRRHAKVPTYDTRIWDGQIRMLRTVDAEMEQIRKALEATGDADNTLVIYMSDNGLLLGEHRLVGKRLPYPEATDVPFAVSDPGVIPGGSVDDRLTSNVDVTPTILAAAGVDNGLRYPLDGYSLLDSKWKRKMQYGESYNVRPDKHWEPPWRSIRTPTTSSSSGCRRRSRSTRSGGSTTTCAPTRTSSTTSCTTTPRRTTRPHSGSTTSSSRPRSAPAIPAVPRLASARG